MDPTPASPQTPASKPDNQSQSLWAPAWYPDPTGRFEFRYHNGQAWTGDVAVDGDRFLDPLATNITRYTAEVGATIGTDARANVGAHAGVNIGQFGAAATRPNPRAVAALVLAISSVLIGWVPFLCALAVVGAVLGIVFGYLALGEIRRDGRLKGRGLALAAVCVAPLGLAISGVGIWLTVLTVREIDRYSNVGEHSTTSTRCTVDSGRAHFDGTIANESNKTRSYHIVVEFLRPGTDNALHTSSVDVNAVGPGNSSDWSVTEPVSQERLDCKVSSITGPLPFTHG